MSESKAKRLFLLQFGGEKVGKSMSVLGADEIRRWVPVIGIVVETDIGWVALETGFSRRALADASSLEAIYGRDPAAPVESPVWGLDGEPFETGLASIGLKVSDLALAAVSHLHIDHSGGVPLLAKVGVPIVIQKVELDFAQETADLTHAYYRPDYDMEVQWRMIDGDHEIAPGIHAMLTPGHTPGHMSYRIEMPETGSWIFAVDAADLAQNLFDPVAVGWTARPEDQAVSLPSIQRLLEEGERRDARVIPCHDPIVWKAIRHPPGGHR